MAHEVVFAGSGFQRDVAIIGGGSDVYFFGLLLQQATNRLSRRIKGETNLLQQVGRFVGITLIGSAASFSNQMKAALCARTDDVKQF
jgi:hypothetical protein